MKIHQGMSSHILTGKYFALFPLTPKKTQLLLISASYHNHIRNMNLKVFYRVIMRLGFQKKILVFHITKCTFKRRRTYLQSKYNTYVLCTYKLFFNQ